MKNKKGLIISLIILLAIISILLTVFMIGSINGKFRFSNLFITHKVSNELVLDEYYDNTFSIINVSASASEIYVKESLEEKVRVVIYGNKDKTDVKVSNNELLILSTEKGCTWFCFNKTIAKIEIYLPKNYENKLDITNNYGDIDIGEFLNATININEDYGDVEIDGGNNIIVNNDYGDVTIGTVHKANIKESCGDIKINTASELVAENNYGDIKVGSVNSYFDISNDCGDIKIENVNIDKNSYIKDDLGNIKLGSTNEIYIDAKTDLGKVKINNNYQKSDVILKIENDCGDIIINN